jgi:phosphoribosylaminoimidazolecarboxamide formyltransferase/IMP cyclohydrolase
MKKNFRRALVSVYNKDRLLEVGKALDSAGVEILSTGSTAKNLMAVSKLCTPESTPESWRIKIMQSILKQ